MVKVLIADSNELIRLGLRSVFANMQNFEIVGEATDQNELKNIFKSFDVDVCVIDYTASDFDINMIPVVLEKYPKAKFIAITPNPSGQTVINAIKAGVLSHVKKECSLGEIIEAVEETSKGSRFFCGNILETIRKEAIDVEELEDVDFSCEAVTISDRELDIIKYIAEGYTNTQIADLLHISTHTVNTHRKNVLSKLGVKNTAGIVMYAVKTELVSPNKFLFSQRIES